jgi:hypothetical protein
MSDERPTRFLNRIHDRIRELLVSEMFPHFVNEPLPKVLAAFFVNRFIADDGELVRARCHENEHGIVFWRLVHSEPLKFFLCSDERIDIQLAALNVNANLARRFRFRIADCGDDPIVLELAEKFFCPHRYQLPLEPPPPKLPPPPLNPLNPPPPPEDHPPPPPPIGRKMGPLRREE